MEIGRTERAIRLSINNINYTVFLAPLANETQRVPRLSLIAAAAGIPRMSAAQSPRGGELPGRPKPRRPLVLARYFGFLLRLHCLHCRDCSAVM